VGLEIVNGITPFDDPSKIAERIDRSNEDIMVVGHEPNLSSLASLLLSGAQSFQCIVFPKTSILSLTRLKVGDQSTPWQINWHISHKLFK
jgi:phosphohistidine phosphatase